MANTFPDGLELTWLGHSTFTLKTPGGKRLLIDPWVQSNPACPADRKDVGPIDHMLITHAHFDHIGDAVEIAKAAKPEVYAVFETASWLGSKGVENGNPMNKGGSIEIGRLRFTMVHADHSCGISDGDQILYGGEAAGWIIRLEDGYTIYHAGDTAVFGDMALIAEIYQPDLALLPIGDRFVMSPREAAHAVRLLKIPDVVPIYWGTFPLLTGTPDAFQGELNNLGVRTEVNVLQPGETLGR